MLRIRLFGSPQISWQEAPIHIGRRLPRVLFYYLAARGIPTDRATLIHLFWSDEFDGNPRTKLRVALSQLRKELGDSSDILETPHDAVQLNPAKIWVDVLEYQKLYEASRLELKQNHAMLSPTAYQNLSTAASLWQPPGFLGNQELYFWTEIDRWRDTQQQNWEIQHKSVLMRLALHEKMVGRVQQSIDWLLKAIIIDQLDAGFYTELINNFLDLGKKHLAKEYYEKIDELYRENFNEPLPDELLTKKTIIYEQTAQPESVFHEWPVRESAQTPFVGQNHPMRQLDWAIQSRHSAIIFGEAGSGKTRLMREYYQRQKSNTRLFFAACQPMEKNLPYQPWIKMLRQVFTPQDWLNLPETWAEQLTPLLPELVTIFPNIQPWPETGKGLSRSYVMEAFAQLFLQVTKTNSITVVFDDVHWADEDSIRLLGYLNERVFSQSRHVNLILATRFEEKNPFLDQLLISASVHHWHRIHMENLTATDITHLVFHVLEQNAPENFVEKLIHDTGGNVFFVLETLQALRDLEKPIDLSQIAHLPMASSIYQLVVQRMQQMAKQSIDVLYTAAVMGSRFNSTVLALALSYPSDSIAAIIETLEQSRWVQSVNIDDGEEYTFIHEKIRDGLLQTIPSAKRRLIHAGISHALEQFLGKNQPSQAAVLAYHCEAAGEYLRAFDYWIMAAQYALRLASLESAINDFQRAEHLLTRTLLTEEKIYSLYAPWINLATDNDDSRTLERLNKTLLQLGQHHNSDLLICIALDGMGEFCFTSNRFAEGLEYTTQALPYAEKSGNPFELTEIQIHHGVFLYMLGRFVESREWFKKVIDLTRDAEDVNLRRSRGNAYYQMSFTSTMLGWPLEGLQYARQSLVDFSTVRDQYGQVTAYSALGIANYLATDYQSGYQDCLKGIEIAKRMEGWRMLGYLHVYAGFNGLQLGYIDQTWQHAQQAIGIGIRNGHHEISSAGHKVLGDIFFRLGDYSKAAKAYQQGLAAGSETFVALESMYRLGITLGMQNDPLGEIYFNRAIAEAEKLGLVSIVQYAQALRLQYFAVKDNDDRFLALLPFIEQEMVRRTNPAAMAFLHLMKAEYAYRHNQFEEAIQAVHMAKPLLNAMPIWLRIRTTSLELGILRKEGHTSNKALENELADLLEQVERVPDVPDIQESWQNFRKKMTKEGL